MEIITQLYNDGFTFDVTKHFIANEKEAYKLLKPYEHLGKIEKESHEGVSWLYISNRQKRIRITVFYGGEHVDGNGNKSVHSN